ncbi:MAG: hypothetical protein A2W80_03610 [Candidatus Riflebacteria bacterium GWC2_50_8]|nr:MAG: hypothetical protein A2W80_03610 [Candidatus Riflebacteria bacterium GWC2_50_8]
MKKFLGYCMMFVLCFGGFSGLWAEEAVAVNEGSAVVSDTAGAPDQAKKEIEFKGKGQPKGDLEQIEASGVVQVTPADPAKNQKYSTIILVSGEKQYKLLPGKDKAGFAELEKMAGQTITVKGGLMPATDKYPMPAIKVDEIPGVSKAAPADLKGKALGKGQAREKTTGE